MARRARRTPRSSGFPDQRSRTGRLSARQCVQQRVQIDRLDQMVVEASLTAPLAVDVLTISGRRDDEDVGKPWQFANGARGLVAVHARQSDVEHDGVWLERGRSFNRVAAVEREPHLVSLQHQRAFQHACGIDVVVDDEAPQGARARGWRAIRRGRGHHFGGNVQRQPDNELASPSTALAVSLDAAAMQSVIRRTSVRPSPSPPCARSSARSSCVNKSKTLGSSRAEMPVPVSTTRTTACAPSAAAVTRMVPRSSVYLAALFNRLTNTCTRRVVSPRISSGRSGRVVTRSWRRASINAACCRCLGDDVPQVDFLQIQRDASARDSGDVEKIVEQAGHVRDLAADHIVRALDDGALLAEALEQLERRAHGRERIAQLVGEHRQELVFLAGGLGQLHGMLAQRGLGSSSPP